MGPQRISHDAYFMVLAQATALRSTCPRRQVGAVLVDANRHVISTGYNGAPPGDDDCLQVGCLMYNDICIRTIHAELNALLRASRQGATLYTTDQPCLNCYKACMTHGIKRVIYLRSYPDEGRDLFIQAYEPERRDADIVHLINCTDYEYLLRGLPNAYAD